MSSPVLSFPLADQQQWQDLVTKALKGVAPDSLHHLDEDGLDIAGDLSKPWVGGGDTA